MMGSGYVSIPFVQVFSYPWCWSFVSWPFQVVGGFFEVAPSTLTAWVNFLSLHDPGCAYVNNSLVVLLVMMGSMYVSILFVLEAIHFVLRACVKSLLDAESMCQKPTWCWEHVSQAYLMLRAWVVPSGCGGQTLICSESALSFQGVSGGRYSRAFTRSPSIPTCIIKVWKRADSIIFVPFTFISIFIFSLEAEHEWDYTWSFRLWAEVSFPFNTL